MSIAETAVKRRMKRGGLTVRCTAEGIERGFFIGGGGGGGEVKRMETATERYKVVTMLATVLCLCNADRVVMSVAVVPLAAKFGWSSAFLGIVQVTTNRLVFLIYLFLLFCYLIN